MGHHRSLLFQNALVFYKNKKYFTITPQSPIENLAILEGFKVFRKK